MALTGGPAPFLTYFKNQSAYEKSRGGQPSTPAARRHDTAPPQSSLDSTLLARKRGGAKDGGVKKRLSLAGAKAVAVDDGGGAGKALSFRSSFALLSLSFCTHFTVCALSFHCHFAALSLSLHCPSALISLFSRCPFTALSPPFRPSLTALPLCSHRPFTLHSHLTSIGFMILTPDRELHFRQVKATVTIPHPTATMTATIPAWF